MWDVFICHAWEDKEEIARPLAEALQQEGLRVWYDEFELKVGDSLRRSVARGLRDSQYGVVILSPSFFAKEWPKKELDGLAAREVKPGKVILPIWHQVTHDDVLNFSPDLADKIGILTDKGVGFVVQELLRIFPEKEAPIIHLRSKPKTVSEEDAQWVFKIRGIPGRPREYIENQFEDQGEVVVDHATGLMWQKSGSDDWLIYEEAQKYVEGLNPQKFAEYNDWRLPTIPELMSLLEPEKQENELYLNPIFDSKQMWCLSVDRLPKGETGSSDVAWGVRFDDGDVSCCLIGIEGYARGVRSIK